VTVLFADLKGLMELLADRDPEEARKLLDPVLELMIEAVHRYEGTVNQIDLTRSSRAARARVCSHDVLTKTRVGVGGAGRDRGGRVSPDRWVAVQGVRVPEQVLAWK
jgi:hypothetical protein